MCSNEKYLQTGTPQQCWNILAIYIHDRIDANNVYKIRNKNWNNVINGTIGH